MNQETKLRTLSVLLTLVPIVMLNTVFAGILDVYNEWWAWSITTVAVVSVALALRFQASLTRLQTVGLLLLPFGVALVGIMV